MIPTDNSDRFNIEIKQVDGNLIKLECKYPTYKEYKGLLKSKKELELISDELEYLEKIEEVFFPYVVNMPENHEDVLTTLDILQFKNSFLDESILSESEKKKLQSQSLPSTLAQVENPSAQ